MAASLGLFRFCAKHAKYARFFITQTSQAKCIKVGDQLPNVTLYEGTPDNTVQTDDIFQGKKGVLFSVPGAFTPSCSRSEGYSEVVCISVNDPFVMEAWGKSIGAKGKIRMLADMKCEFTKAIKMELDCSDLLGNIRSRRYFLLVEDNKVQHVSREPDDSGLSCLLCIKRIKQDDVDNVSESFQETLNAQKETIG